MFRMLSASYGLVGTAAPDYTLRMCNTCWITGRQSATEEGHDLNNAANPVHPGVDGVLQALMAPYLALERKTP